MINEHQLNKHIDSKLTSEARDASEHDRTFVCSWCKKEMPVDVVGRVFVDGKKACDFCCDRGE